MSVKVLRSGLYTSIQDTGRIGYGKYGIPESGVMDTYASRLANLLVGNKAEAAILEITLTGPELYFENKTKTVVCGLEAEVFLNNLPVVLNEVFQVEAGSVLNIRNVTKGNFLYLAVSGGFQTEVVLSSRSMYEGITHAARVKKGDELPVLFQPDQHKQPAFASVRFDKDRYAEDALPVYPGPEWIMLSDKEQADLLSRKFTLSSGSSRMAFILNEKIKHQSQSILTVPVLPGTVQLTPGGQLIILMRDGQVTGGYPRILQMDEAWLDVLAQKRAGEQVRFVMERWSDGARGRGSDGAKE